MSKYARAHGTRLKKSKAPDDLDLKPGDRLVKIRYSFTHISMGEKIGAMLELTIISMIVGVYYIFTDYPEFPTLVFVLISSTAFLPFIVILPDYRSRKSQKRLVDIIMRKGVVLIGEIVSLYSTEVNNQKNFSYNIEYEDPNSRKTITIRTPSVLYDEMYIRESDLPLKCTVYVYQDLAFCDRIINPPTRKMHRRKIIYYLPEMIFITAALVSFLLGLMLNNSVIIGLGACASVAMYYLYLSSKKGKE